MRIVESAMHPQRLSPPARRGVFCLAGTLLLGGCVTLAPNLDRTLRTSQYGQATAPMLPLTQASDEATPYQLRLAWEQGRAEKEALDWMLKNAASDGGRMLAGEYEVAYLLMPPQGWYEPSAGALTWNTPGEASAHLRVVVMDGADGRLVPDVDVHAVLMDASGKVVESKVLRFGWDPVLSGYSENIHVPTPGVYHLRLELGPPSYRRHDPVNGDRFIDKTFAEFDHVQIPAVGTMRVVASPPITLSQRVGDMLGATLEEMTGRTANDGGEKRVGDYLIAYAIEYAEAYWIPHHDSLRYTIEVEQSAAKNAHVEVAVRDALTGRFLPDLHVEATLYDEKGRKIGTHREPFMWHPWLYHYGENWRVPGSGRYRLHIHIDPPPYRRYDRDLGNRFAQPAEVEFEPILIKTGQK